MDETDVNLPNTMKNFINQFLRIMGTLIIVAYTLPLVIFAIFPLAVGVIMILKTYIKTSRMLRRSASSTAQSTAFCMSCKLLKLLSCPKRADKSKSVYVSGIGDISYHSDGQELKELDPLQVCNTA